MDVSAIAHSINVFYSAQAGNTVMVKKALDAEAQGAMALVDALPQPAVRLPDYLGQNINTAA